MKNLSAWLEDIQSRHPKSWDLGLERVGEVGRRLGLTRPAPLTILVAGTNGKGSTCEYLAQFCHEAGLSYGKTTSPHFSRYNEQFEIDQALATDQDIIDALEAVDAERGDISLSYFEYGALIAMWLFKKAAVDVAILEIGLGGRLDAMNIVDADVSIITRIALDHQDWLGDTRELIGAEKAGVMRKSKPVIVLDEDPPLSLLKHAEEVGAELYLVNRDFQVLDEGFTHKDVSFNLQGAKLPKASAIAALVSLMTQGVQFEQQVLDHVLERTSLPGRFQRLELDPVVILDVCHNPDAAQYLVQKLIQENLQGVHLVAGLYKDKDSAGVFQHLAPLAASWHLASIDDPRGASAEELAEVLSDACGLTSQSYDKVADAIAGAVNVASAGETVVILGSFVTVTEALEYFSLR